jgi:hypothetical protein
MYTLACRRVISSTPLMAFRYLLSSVWYVCWFSDQNAHISNVCGGPAINMLVFCANLFSTNTEYAHMYQMFKASILSVQCKQFSVNSHERYTNICSSMHEITIICNPSCLLSWKQFRHKNKIFEVVLIRL